MLTGDWIRRNKHLGASTMHSLIEELSKKDPLGYAILPFENVPK